MTDLTETQLQMLLLLFPRHVLEHILNGLAQTTKSAVSARPAANYTACIACSHANVTLLFMDVVGFTTMSKQVPPDQVMRFIHSLYSVLDELVDKHDVYKVDTAGDSYIVAGGLMTRDGDGFDCIDKDADAVQGAEKVLSFAKAMLSCAKAVKMPHNGRPAEIRVGVHTGEVITGLVGSKLPKFSLFGDTMNTASRMESTCRPGCIQVSAATKGILSSGHVLTPTGGVDVKGKGVMQTYL